MNPQLLKIVSVNGGIWQLFPTAAKVPDLVSDGRSAGAEVPFSGPAPIIILPSFPYVAVTLTHGTFSRQPEADPFHIANKLNFSSYSFLYVTISPETL